MTIDYILIAHSKKKINFLGNSNGDTKFASISATNDIVLKFSVIHSFFIRMLFFRPRLNILIFLPILG